MRAFAPWSRGFAYGGSQKAVSTFGRAPLPSITKCIGCCWPALEGTGAGDGNRTHVSSLGSCSSTIELHPRWRGILCGFTVPYQHPLQGPPRHRIRRPIRPVCPTEVGGLPGDRADCRTSAPGTDHGHWRVTGQRCKRPPLSHKRCASAASLRSYVARQCVKPGSQSESP
jgi:hypothetical protein